MKKLMEYHIVSGRTVETRRTWLPIGPSYRKPRGTRRVGASSLKKIRANERSCVLNLARTINCNFEGGDWFVAFKYDSDHYRVESREDEFETAKKIFTKKFLPKLRSKYKALTGKKLKAVWVTANWSPKRKHFTRIHHHVVLPADAFPMAQELWKEFGGSDGTVQAEMLNSEGDYTRIAAYMVDNVHERPAGENKWSACRGMDKPLISEPVEVDDVESIEPMPNAIVKDVLECTDEDGRVFSKYMRTVLPDRVEVRRGLIVLPKRRRKSL